MRKYSFIKNSKLVLTTKFYLLSLLFSLFVFYFLITFLSFLQNFEYLSFVKSFENLIKSSIKTCLFICKSFFSLTNFIATEFKIWQDKVFRPVAITKLPNPYFKVTNITGLDRNFVCLLDINDVYYDHYSNVVQNPGSFLRNSKLKSNSASFVYYLGESNDVYLNRPSHKEQDVRLKKYVEYLNIRDQNVIMKLDFLLQRYKNSTESISIKRKKLICELFYLDSKVYPQYYSAVKGVKFRDLDQIFKYKDLFWTYTSSEGKNFLDQLTPSLQSKIEDYGSRDKLAVSRLLVVNESNTLRIYNIDRVYGPFDIKNPEHKRLLYWSFQKRNMAIAQILTLDSLAYGNGYVFSPDEACKIYDTASQIVHQWAKEYYKNNPNVYSKDSDSTEALRLLRFRIIIDLARGNRDYDIFNQE